MGRPVVLVTGASSGIGRVTAEHFDAAGYRVFGTSRTPGAVSHRAGVHMLPLDVRDEAAVKTCVDNVQAEAGRIDVLVSNAGHMVFGPAEEVPLEDARAMFDTNFWGAVRVANAVLPHMRERGAGRVVLVGSIAAIAAIPMNAFYAASSPRSRGTPRPSATRPLASASTSFLSNRPIFERTFGRTRTWPPREFMHTRSYASASSLPFVLYSTPHRSRPRSPRRS